MTPLFEPDRAPLALPVVIVGGGPAGLMAAEVLSQAGVAVHLFDAMASVGRKFLLAGRGGLNLTHGEPLADFGTRYPGRAEALAPWLQAFGPEAVRDWAQGLGIETFVGSSQRVFPLDMKAAPLLRAWLQRLRHPAAGGPPVRFYMRHRWTGWQADPAGGPPLLHFEGPEGPLWVRAGAVLLALGGASWARLGSDGRWVVPLRANGVAVADLKPSNCGFEVAGSGLHGPAAGWSAHFVQRFAGHPLKTVRLRCPAPGGDWQRKGELVVTEHGIEGSLVYAASALLREAIEAQGTVRIGLDLLPDRSPEQVLAQVAHPRGSRSMSAHLKSRLGLDGVKMGLLHECCPSADWSRPERLAAAIKDLPLDLARTRPIDEAISSAGGVCLEALDEQLMSRQQPGLFFAGEMLDWEAPTGGYLLTACLASGRVSGQGMLAHLQRQNTGEGAEK